MKLPTQKTAPQTNINTVTMLLYGDPKIGKSTFCSRFENAFFIATEPGLNHLETYNLRADTWREAYDILSELQENPGRFSPIVIDTVDRLWELCCRYICEQNNLKALSSMGYGKGYEFAEVEFNYYLQDLVKLNTGLIFTSHATYDTFINSEGEQTKKFMPSVDKRVRKYLNPLVDIIGYISMVHDVDKSTGEKVEKRIFHAHENIELWEAGDRTGKLPAEFPFSQKVYKSFFETKEQK